MAAYQPPGNFNSMEMLKFGIMQVQVNLEYEQLLKIVKILPAGKLRQLLKAAIDHGAKSSTSNDDLENLLLNGPTATKKQLDIIENNRKLINQWKTK